MVFEIYLYVLKLLIMLFVLLGGCIVFCVINLKMVLIFSLNIDSFLVKDWLVLLYSLYFSLESLKVM